MQAQFTVDGRPVSFDVTLESEAGGRLVPPTSTTVTTRKCPSSPVLAYSLLYERIDNDVAIYTVLGAARP